MQPFIHSPPTLTPSLTPNSCTNVIPSQATSQPEPIATSPIPSPVNRPG